MASTLGRSLTVTLFALLLSASALAQRPDPPGVQRLDHTARQLVRAAAERVEVREARMLAPIYDVSVTADDEVRVGVLVRMTDVRAVADLQARGFVLETLAGNVAVGTVAAHRLGDVAATRGVGLLEVSRMLELLNDNGGEAIRLPEVHAGLNLPQAYRGQGVIVGVLDTGIDFSHPDFSDDSGTRIEYLLDYLPDNQNQPPAAQAEWTRAQIDADPTSVTQRDISGHGTHVAGTAAGGGRANPDLVGAAPESRLIIVKGSRTGSDPSRPHVFSERDIINGTAYIFDRAAELGMPAVVNLSIGAHGGPLDGSQNANIAMSNLTGPGRIAVYAAGNDGARLLHWGRELQSGERATMAFEYSQAASAFVLACCGQFIRIDGWYEPGTVGSVTVTARDRVSLQEVASLSIPVGEEMLDFAPLAGANGNVGHARLAASTIAHPDNGDGYFLVDIASMYETGVNLRHHIWSVTVEGASPGRVDAWMVVRTMGEFLTDGIGIPHFVPGDNLMTLNRHAAGHEIISAGSFTTRNSWLNVLGNPEGVSWEIGPRSPFSSFGPTRDGRIRPDVVAPGAMIASALSSHVPGSFGWSYQDPNYAIASGTSMAAPFLSGTIALMLQVNPHLTPAQVRSILHETARRDEHTGPVADPGYGYGKLDAFAAVRRTLALAYPGEADVLALEAPFPNPARDFATLVFNLPAESRTTIVLYDLLGREVRRVLDEHLPAGPHWVEVRRDGLAAGVYLLAIRDGRGKQARRITFVN